MPITAPARTSQVALSRHRKSASALARLGNLAVLDIDAASVDALAAVFARTMRFDAIVQDGELQLLGDAGAVVLHPRTRMAPAAA